MIMSIYFYFNLLEFIATGCDHVSEAPSVHVGAKHFEGWEVVLLDVV